MINYSMILIQKKKNDQLLYDTGAMLEAMDPSEQIHLCN